MGFGISLGKKKQSSTTNSTITKNENTSQSGLEATNQTQTQTGSTSTTGQTSSTGSSTTSGVTNQTQTGTSSQTQTGQQSSFSDATKAGLESGIAALLGGVAGDQATIRNGANALSFDGAAYVRDAVAAAQANADDTVAQGVNGLFDSLGGTGNTMGALLAQKMRNQAAAQVAGVRAQAEQTAAGIEQNQVTTQSNALGGLSSLAATIANALKGGNVTTSGTTTGSETQTTAGSSSSSTQTAEQQQQSQQQQTQQVSNLIGLVSQLLNSTTNTLATENSKTKGKSSGGGLSLSI